MTDANSQVLDLWGNPVYVRAGKRGRPPFERTEENANKVSMLLAMGWNNERIAACIPDPRTGKPISLPTLKRHFRAELQQRDHARDRLVARRLMRAWEAAEKGNVGAERILDKLIERNDMMRAEERYGESEAASPVEKTEKLGKKEISERIAEEADAALMAELEAEATGGVRH